jgi:hypothetical protein
VGPFLSFSNQRFSKGDRLRCRQAINRLLRPTDLNGDKVGSLSDPPAVDFIRNITLRRDIRFFALSRHSIHAASPRMFSITPAVAVRNEISIAWWNCRMSKIAQTWSGEVLRSLPPDASPNFQQPLS